MNAYTKAARIVSVLFIAATAAIILSGPFISSLDAPNYLVDIAANQDRVLIGMLLQMIWAFAVTGIPVVLFPILKKHSETLALGFFSARLVEGVFSVAFIICQLSLLTLSQEYVAAGAQDAAYYQAAGTLMRAARDWAFEMGPGIVFTLSALILNYALYTSRLVPRWLSGWGLVGALLMLASYLSKFFGINLPEVLFVPIALQEMAFAVWLIVKGFEPAAVAAGAAKQQQTGVQR